MFVHLPSQRRGSGLSVGNRRVLSCQAKHVAFEVELGGGLGKDKWDLLPEFVAEDAKSRFKEANFEVEGAFRFRDGFLNCFRSFLPQESIRVFALGHQSDTALETHFSEDFHRAHGRLLTSFIGVIKNCNFVTEALEELGVVLGERGTEAGNGFFDSCPVTGDDVEVALDENRVPLLHHPVAGFVKSIEHAAFAVERGIGTVNVLRASVAQDATTKTDEVASVIADWEHESTEEFIGVSILLVALNKEQALSLD